MTNENMLVDVDVYLNSGVHIGTKFQNAYSKDFIQKAREDGLKIINLEQIDSKLRVLINYISKFKPNEIVIMGKRENAKKGLALLSKLTGIEVFTGRYFPGKLTNTNFEEFREYKMVLICDPLCDKNILNEAFGRGIFTAAFCDTNNLPNKLDLIVPLNNKGKSSLGLALYLIAKGYLANRKILNAKDFKYEITDFTCE